MEMYNGKPYSKLTDFDLNLSGQLYCFEYNRETYHLYSITICVNDETNIWKASKIADFSKVRKENRTDLLVDVLPCNAHDLRPI